MDGISEQFVNVLIILGAVQGLLVALFLFYKRKQNKANIFLFFMTLVSFLQVGLVLWSGTMADGSLKMAI
ncbi:MAG: LPXTG cell wall anchor domain-containing protein, partial [Aurantibacter sp.]